MLNLTENIFWDVNRNYTGDVVTLEDFYEEEPVVSDVSEPLKDGTIDQNCSSEEMYVKSNGVWQCKVCEKTCKLIGDMKRRIEVHIEGDSYSCNLCGKLYCKCTCRKDTGFSK